MHKRGICRHLVSVCLSVTFVSCAKTNKDIFEIFSPSGSQAILVFSIPNGVELFQREPPKPRCRYVEADYVQTNTKHRAVSLRQLSFVSSRAGSGNWSTCWRSFKHT